MTGYGEAEAFTSRGKLSVQLKSLNSKNFELNFRANSSFQQFEFDAKKQLLKKLKRGKIELFVVEDSTNIAVKSNCIPIFNFLFGTRIVK